MESGSAVYRAGFITTLETLAGGLACVGLVLLLKNFTPPYTQFGSGKSWVMLGACCAVLVLDVGFMAGAGDWFMARQAKENSLSTPQGALLYTVHNILALIFLVLQKD